MHRIDTATAVAVLPAPEAAGPPGYFTKGDAVGGVAATVPGPDWFNMMQEEAIAILDALGVTPDQTKADYGQIIDALLASFANIGGSAAQLFRAALATQFTADSQVATTEFVQRALGNFRSFVGLNATTTLTAADVGKSYEVAHTTVAFDVNLPLSDASVPSGGALYFRNDNIAVVTIKRQGADIIHMGGAQATAITLAAGDSLWVVKGANGFWFCCGGTAQLRYCNDFAKSLANPGWYRLPSGIIRQFGTTVSIPSGGSLAVTYPITFPAAANWPRVTPVLSGAGACYMQATSRLLTGFTINNSSPTAAEAVWSSDGY